MQHHSRAAHRGPQPCAVRRVNADPGTVVAEACGEGKRFAMRNKDSGRLRPRALRLIAASAAIVLLVVGGCGQLAEKERELTFRVVPGTASWFGGLPTGVQETDLSVDAEGKSQRVHAWWWPAGSAHAPAVLYLHGSRWNLTGQTARIEQLHEFGFSVLAI